MTSSRQPCLTANAKIHRHRIGVGGGAGAAVAQGLAVVGQAGGEGVALHPLARFLHQVGEGRQRHELAGGEEVAERRHAVVLHARSQRVFSGIATSGFHSGFALRATASMLRRRREIDAPALALGDDRHQPRAHAPGLALGLDVVARDRRARHQAPEVRPARRAWCRSSPPPHPSACPPSP